MAQPKLNILVVDDSENDLLILQEVFGVHEEVTLNRVSSGQEALKYLRGEFSDDPKPNLILLDINMPIMDGFDVLRELKKDPVLRQIPVIMLTVSTRDEDVRRSYEEGASSYVAKPISLDEFEELARKFVQYWTKVALLPE